MRLNPSSVFRRTVYMNDKGPMKTELYPSRVRVASDSVG